MTRRDEVEAAYFQLLRAREEVEHLQRYEEHLLAEQQRAERALHDARQRPGEVPLRLRRVFRVNDEALVRALEQRLRIIADERRHLPDRRAAAEAFVEECELEHDLVRAGR